MKFLFLITMMISLSAFATNVELRIQANWKKGNTVKNTVTRVIAKLDHNFTIPFEDEKSLKFELTATQDFSKIPTLKGHEEENTMLFEGHIYSMVEGKEKLVSSPMVVTHIGSEATFKTESKEEFFELKITPVKLL